jgi:radical SAM superfamily enzyme YgiQ (UPF0313 family)
MPRLVLVYPCVGRFPGSRYVRSWQMQPLAMAVLAGLTPREWDVTFFDDRLEPVDYRVPADLVGISIETFTARRGYQIAAAFCERRIPVVMGGYHATSCPDEALQHADAVCVGEAEGVWGRILEDCRAGRLQGRYEGPRGAPLENIRPDRRIFRGKNYFSIAPVETGRGCSSRCDFCSVSAFFQATHRRRPAAEVVEELQRLQARRVFFVDDNILGNAESATELFDALRPLKIKWVSQATLDAARNESLLDCMASSGCVGLLIGFESLEADNLTAMGKRMCPADEYEQGIARLRRAGISIYGTFVFGYPHDTRKTFFRTVDFARRNKLYLAAFNHVVPFPGTPLYRRLEAEGRLPLRSWWMDGAYRFGQAPFTPWSLTAAEIEAGCHAARRRFFSVGSILDRGMDLAANAANLRKAGAFFALNFLLQREVSQKRGIPLGAQEKESGRIPAPDGTRITFRLGARSDDAAIRSLLKRNPMPGAMSISFGCEPSFFDAIEVEGADPQVIVGERGGRIRGMGMIATRHVYINGTPSTAGYLANLRIDPDARHATGLARGYRFLRKLHQKSPRGPFALTTIMEDNTLARSLLTSRRAGLPVYREIGRYHTLAFPLFRRHFQAPRDGCRIVRGDEVGAEALARCLAAYGKEKQFYPVYAAGDLAAGGGILRGLSLRDFLVALKGDQPVGIMGCWDQSAFRQRIVSDYSGILAWLRPLIHAGLRAAGSPGFPEKGESVKSLMATAIAIQDNRPDVFQQLLQRMLQERGGKTWGFLLLGLARGDALLDTARKHFHFSIRSRIYAVDWGDGEAAIQALDSRVPYLELGSL